MKDLRYNKKQKYIVCDVETDGLNLIYSRPWQVSWVECDAKGVVAEHDLYVDYPDLVVSDEIAKLTGFDRSIYNRKKESPESVLRKLDKFVYDPEYMIIGQNFLKFDIFMHNNLRKMCGLSTDYSYLNRVIDTRALAIALAKEIPIDRENFLTWQFSLLTIHERKLKTSQETLLKHYGIAFDRNLLHNSLYDVKMTFEIFKKQIYDIEL